MSDNAAIEALFAAERYKNVPQDPGVRARIRAAAGEMANSFDRSRPLSREELEARAGRLLESAGACPCFLGFAMVAVSNAFWRSQFAAVPPERRILLLPHCMRDSERCAGRYSAEEFHCAECGSCDLGALKAEAEAMGYRTAAAEGSPMVVKLLLDEPFDAILGVACLESLEKAFHKIASLGVPHLASPLLVDGCKDTVADAADIRAMLGLRPAPAEGRTRNYLPLLRFANRLFEAPLFERLMGDNLAMLPEGQAFERPAECADALAGEWLREGGKRLRPFIALAAFAAARHGGGYFLRGSAGETDFPLGALRVAAAIEVFHKASLVHDDIEDDDPSRYGRPTLHRRHGAPMAINAGDFLIGLGYRLVAGEAADLGAETVADLLAALSGAQLRLCRGQGAEMAWTRRPAGAMSALDALAVYSGKTAPAFEVALYAGLRMAGRSLDSNRLREFARSIGVAYQIQDDLQEWEAPRAGEPAPGFDALAGRATLPRAFALEAANEEERRIILAPPASAASPRQHLERLATLYERLGAFDKARELADRFRRKALQAADAAGSPEIADLLRLLVDTILAAQ